MKMIETYLKYKQISRMKRTEKLRDKNDFLRKQGKDPLKGWKKIVDTGVGGGNNVMVKTGSGLVDLTGNNEGIENYFSGERKQLIEEVDMTRKQDINQSK